jgi:hypothetical protein
MLPQTYGAANRTDKERGSIPGELTQLTVILGTCVGP